MNSKEIQELLDFIANSGLSEVNIETEDVKISVKKYPENTARYNELSIPQQYTQLPASHSDSSHSLSSSSNSVDAASSGKVEKTKEIVKDNYVTIKSPMIGTFYRSSNPESPYFVNVGDEIKTGQTVCIIEAMKLFNEIESEISGKIVKVLVENSSPIEYDQPLFLVEPI